MGPIPGFDQVQVVWLRLEKEGFSLFGFLLYTSSDRVVVDYMKEGIFDLDILSGDECYIFVIESPSKEWIELTKQSNHSWWRLFGREHFEKENKNIDSGRKGLSLLEKNIVENNRDCTIVIGNENCISLNQIIEPPSNLLFNRAEALNVAKHFGLGSKDVPCLIFFKDLKSDVIWKSSIGEFESQKELKNFFRDFFDSSDFLSLLK